jgi:hypothetical protein
VAFGPGAVPFYGGAGSYVNGLPKGWSESNDISGTFAEMFKWARVVCESTACDLPGVHIKFGSFVSNMWKAVRTGHVDPRHAEFVHNGLRWGFEVGYPITVVRRERMTVEVTMDTQRNRT